MEISPARRRPAPPSRGRSSPWRRDRPTGVEEPPRPATGDRPSARPDFPCAEIGGRPDPRRPGEMDGTDEMNRNAPPAPRERSPARGTRVAALAAILGGSRGAGGRPGPWSPERRAEIAAYLPGVMFSVILG